MYIIRLHINVYVYMYIYVQYRNTLSQCLNLNNLLHCYKQYIKEYNYPK